MSQPKPGAWSYAYHTETQEPPSFVLQLTAEEMLLLEGRVVLHALHERVVRTLQLVDRDCGPAWRETVSTGAGIKRINALDGEPPDGVTNADGRVTDRRCGVRAAGSGI